MLSMININLTASDYSINLKIRMNIRNNYLFSLLLRKNEVYNYLEYKMWLNNLKTGLKKGFLNKDRGFIRRWPKDPKIVFFGPPNVFQEEISQRFAIDLGVPVISMDQIL